MSIKHTHVCKRDELAAVFRAIADSLEGKPVEGAPFPSFESFRKLKIGVKDEFGQVTVKIKARTDLGDLEMADCACGGVAPDGKPSYKSLKKRMRSSFKAVYQAVHRGVLPPAEAVEAFVQESRLMVQYPGYGDEYYDAYSKAVDAFEAAWAAKDTAALHVSVDALNHIKTDCHQRYD